MAKKTTTSKKFETTTPKAAPKAAAKPTVKTAVRNSPIPKPVTGRKTEITSEQIARRAFEIYTSGKGGSETDNWFQAERELRSGV